MIFALTYVNGKSPENKQLPGHHSLLWPVQGTASLLVNQTRTELRTGDLFFVDSTADLRWVAPPEIYQRIFFSELDIRRLSLIHPEINFTGLFCNGASRVFDGLDNDALTTIKRIEQLAEQAVDGPVKEALLFHFLASVLCILLRAADAAYASGQALPEQLSRLLQLVEQQYREQRNPGYYADQLGIPIRRLNRFAMLHKGKSVRSIIDAHLLAEAERLLSETHLPVKTIAYDLGFDDPNYFSTFFKRHRRLSPVKYRLTHHFKGN